MSIQDRVQHLEDAESVEHAKLRQMMALDAVVNDRASITALENELTPDFQWRSGQFGHYAGRAAFRSFVDLYAQRVTFSLHFLSGSATRISPDRSRAEGKWVVWQPFTLERVPWLLAGRFHDTFTRQGERWLISASELTVEILSPWTTGWGENRISNDWVWPTR